MCGQSILSSLVRVQMSIATGLRSAFRRLSAAVTRASADTGRGRPEQPASLSDYPDLLQEVERRLRSTQPHEEDFRFFAHLDGRDGLFVDIGANWGQSAISFRLFNKTFRIISFEPNAKLEPALDLIKRRFGDTFEYRMHGLGERDEVRALHVPKTKGANLSPSGSLAPGEFQKSYVVERLKKESRADGGNFAFYELQVDIRKFDDLGIRPDVVKIDVEGWECEVLRGMADTIGRYRPLLMIELNNVERVMPMLDQLGYVAFAYDPASDRLIRWHNDYSVLNVFLFHHSELEHISAKYGVHCADAAE